VMVDMAGNAEVISQVHHHYGDNMKYSCRIGATHFDKMGSSKNLPGATPEFFFAPSHREARSAELGSDAFTKQMWKAFANFRKFCDNWMSIEYSYGPDAVKHTYQSILTGKANPATGQIVSISPK
jgi:hypothetical protein